jgi:hypothetical protein
MIGKIVYWVIIFVLMLCAALLGHMVSELFHVASRELAWFIMAAWGTVVLVFLQWIGSRLNTKE